MLRFHTRTHTGHSRRRRHAASKTPHGGSAARMACWAGWVRPCGCIHQRRRKMQRCRQPQVPAPDQGEGLRRGIRHSPQAGTRRSHDPRCEHGRRDVGHTRRDGPFPQPHGLGSRGGAPAVDDRLVALRGHRGRLEVHTGQIHSQLTVAQGGRGDIPQARPPRA